MKELVASQLKKNHFHSNSIYQAGTCKVPTFHSRLHLLPTLDIRIERVYLALAEYKTARSEPKFVQVVRLSPY